MDPLIIEPSPGVSLHALSGADEELSSAVRETVLELDSASGWRCTCVLFNRMSGGIHIQTAPHLPERFCAALAALCAIASVEGVGRRIDGGTTPNPDDSVDKDFLDRVRELADLHGLSLRGSAPVWDGTGALAGWVAAFGGLGGRPSPESLQPIAKAAQLLAIAIERQRIRRHQAAQDASLLETTRTLEATLEKMEQGVMVVSPNRIVELCNRRAIEILDLPPALMRARPRFEAVFERQWSKVTFL